MKQLSPLSEASHSPILNRRTILSTLTLALTGASLASAKPPKKALKVFKQYFTIADLIQDTTVTAGTVVTTLGYHQPGDCGGATYKVIQPTDHQAQDFGILLANKLYAVLLHEGFVNYAMFGTHSNGKEDDGIAIKKAHEFANAHAIPVNNPSGEFWLQDTRNIPIKTNTFWGSTVFHINEQFNTRTATNFEVLSQHDAFEITLTDSEKKQLLQELTLGARYVPSLERYKNHLICIVDNDDRIGVRYGESYKGTSWAKEEFFYVEEGGVIIGDIAWEFKNFTKLMAYPANTSYLTIDGGTFLMSGDSPGPQGGAYQQGGITIRRSRTIIKNQWVGLEASARDVALTPRAGFYTFSYVYDVLLENVRLIPWEQKRAEEARIVRAGTYGIGGNRILNATFRNVTAEGSMLHWGVFGTNLNKNFVIENCQLNRVDVHFHCWNIAIRNSSIGQRGITLTGGGKLVMENTTVYHNRFIDMRQDYGGKWDGPIHIKNCTLVPQTDSEATILTLVPADFDYKYPIVVGRQISIDQFQFDYSMAPNNNATAWAIRFPGYSISSIGKRVIFPSNIQLMNITTQFRSKGIRLFSLPDTTSFYVTSGKGNITEDFLETNALVEVKNIHLEAPEANIEPVHLRISTGKASSYLDQHALYPSIQIQNCDYFSGEIKAAAKLSIEHSIITALQVGSTEKEANAEVSFNHCTLVPRRVTKEAKYFPLHTTYGISFTNCLLCPPHDSKQSYPEEFEQYSFIRLNKQLLFNHSNTRLSKSILRYLSEKKVVLQPKFVAMLKNHHELESSSL